MPTFNPFEELVKAMEMKSTDIGVPDEDRRLFALGAYYLKDLNQCCQTCERHRRKGTA